MRYNFAAASLATAILENLNRKNLPLSEALILMNSSGYNNDYLYLNLLKELINNLPKLDISIVDRKQLGFLPRKLFIPTGDLLKPFIKLLPKVIETDFRPVIELYINVLIKLVEHFNETLNEDEFRKNYGSIRNQLLNSPIGFFLFNMSAYYNNTYKSAILNTMLTKLQIAAPDKIFIQQHVASMMLTYAGFIWGDESVYRKGISCSNFELLSHGIFEGTTIHEFLKDKTIAIQVSDLIHEFRWLDMFAPLKDFADPSFATHLIEVDLDLNILITFRRLKFIHERASCFVEALSNCAIDQYMDIITKFVRVVDNFVYNVVKLNLLHNEITKQDINYIVGLFELLTYCYTEILHKTSNYDYLINHFLYRIYSLSRFKKFPYERIYKTIFDDTKIVNNIKTQLRNTASLIHDVIPYSLANHQNHTLDETNMHPFYLSGIYNVEKAYFVLKHTKLGKEIQKDTGMLNFYFISKFLSPPLYFAKHSEYALQRNTTSINAFAKLSFAKLKNLYSNISPEYYEILYLHTFALVSFASMKLEENTNRYLILNRQIPVSPKAMKNLFKVLNLLDQPDSLFKKNVSTAYLCQIPFTIIHTFETNENIIVNKNIIDLLPDLHVFAKSLMKLFRYNASHLVFVLNVYSNNINLKHILKSESLIDDYITLMQDISTARLLVMFLFNNLKPWNLTQDKFIKAFILKYLSKLKIDVMDMRSSGNLLFLLSHFSKVYFRDRKIFISLLEVLINLVKVGFNKTKYKPDIFDYAIAREIFKITKTLIHQQGIDISWGNNAVIKLIKALKSSDILPLNELTAWELQLLKNPNVKKKLLQGSQQSLL